MDVEKFAITHNLFAFPPISVNYNPVNLNFKFPKQAAIQDKAKDKIYCIVVVLELHKKILGKGITAPFRMCIKVIYHEPSAYVKSQVDTCQISQFKNPEAAQERLRRHTKKRQEPESNPDLPPTPPASDYNFDAARDSISEILGSVPQEFVSDMIIFLQQECEKLKVRF